MEAKRPKLESVLPTIQYGGNNAGSLPHAYLNWIFFDENFNLKEYDPLTGLGSGAYRVEASGDNKSLTKAGIKAPGNGYVFIYISNTSNTNVWFDNLSVTHARSRLMQEHHYYPYGLQIASISSKSHGKLDNYFRFQGSYSEFEEETGWDNFTLRNYDPQLGRWTSIDPFDEFPTGYIGMGGDPVNLIDPTGGFSFPSGPPPVPEFKFEPLKGLSPFVQGLSSSLPGSFYDWILSKNSGKIYFSDVSSQMQTDRAFGEGNFRYLGKHGFFAEDVLGKPIFYTDDGAAFKFSPVGSMISLKIENLPAPPRNSFIVFGDKFETQQTRDMIRRKVLDEDIAQMYADRLGDAGGEALLTIMVPQKRAGS